jgi:CRISPR-associated protein Cst2
MSWHLFGLILTPYGSAANNRGESEGNITTLQKILWNGEVHTTVSAEAIRWAIRYYWQQVKGDKVLNRRWRDEEGIHEWEDPEFKKWNQEGIPAQDVFLDDDVLGFMSAKAAKQEGGVESAAEESGEEEAKPKKRTRQRQRGTCDKRRSRLEVTRAISLTPFGGDITFNAASVGATPSASKTGKDPVPYGTEVHATRYQYAFAITPQHLKVKAGVLDVLEAVVSLADVAGNHARFLFDFAPDSVAFRWTPDYAPRILYGFELDPQGRLGVPGIIRKVEAGDIAANELILGGSIAETDDARRLETAGAKVYKGVQAAATDLRDRIIASLGIAR